jgi:hypothetical protein
MFGNVKCSPYLCNILITTLNFKTRPMEIIFWILSMCMGLLFGYTFLQNQKNKRILMLLIVVSCLWFICAMVMY